MSTQNLILNSDSSSNRIYQDLDAQLNRWQLDTDDVFLYEGTVDNGPDIHVHIWADAVSVEDEIRLVFDDHAKVRYITVRVSDSTKRGRLLGGLRAHFQTYTTEDLREAVRREVNTDPQTFVRLALALSEPDDESAALITSGLESPCMEVRAGAAMAVALLRWPKFGPAIQKAKETERDSRNVRLLEVISRGYKTQ